MTASPTVAATGTEEADLASGAGVEALVPGYAWQVQQLSDTLAAHATVLGDAATSLSRIEVTDWRGRASDSFGERIGVEPGRWSAASIAFGDAATALSTYAASLAPAREVAREAVRLYQQYLQTVALVSAVTDDHTGQPSPAATPVPGSGVVDTSTGSRMLIGYRAQRLRGAVHDGVASAGGALLGPVAAAVPGLALGADQLRRAAVDTLVRARAVVAQAGDLAAEALTRAMAQAPQARRFWQGTIRPPGAEGAAHTALDGVGMVPGWVGVGANAVNVGWYYAEGQKSDAAVSAAMMVPFTRVLRVGHGVEGAGRESAAVVGAGADGLSSASEANAAGRAFVDKAHVVAGASDDLDAVAEAYGLQKIGATTYLSPGGLTYADLVGNGVAADHRLPHVLFHGFDDATKQTHTVFAGGPRDVVDIIDRAWASLSTKLVPGDATAYVVDLHEPVGAGGETKVRLVVNTVGPEGPSRLITAYPVQ